MRSYSASPYEMFSTIWKNRNLIMVSVNREVIGRYKGSVIGILWSFLNPILMLSVYTFIFSVVFQARWGVNSTSKTEFALVLFIGLIIFGLFSECINRAPSLVISNVNYVKKVVYPLEILPVVTFFSAIFHMTISLIVWIIVYTLFFGIPHITLFLFPIVLVPFGMFIMGLSWFLASLGVYIRDISQIIGVLISVLMFMSPVFYPVSALPKEYQAFLALNPLTAPIEASRDLLYWGVLPDSMFLLVYWLSTAMIACFGFFWFQRTRKGFADVL